MYTHIFKYGTWLRRACFAASPSPAPRRGRPAASSWRAKNQLRAPGARKESHQSEENYSAFSLD